MLKKILSMLVMLLCLPPLLFSDVSLTDEEYQAITTALDNSETELMLQEKTTSGLEQQLTQLKDLHQISNDITKAQGQNYEQLKTYLELQEKGQTVKRIRAFIYGTMTGLAGLYVLEKLE